MERQVIELRLFAAAIEAEKNCMKSGNTDWQVKWDDLIYKMCKLLPHGSGIDAGSQLLREECTPVKIVIKADFHHMNEGGFYDGWTEHKIIITPEFGGFHMKVTGRDRNMIKDYLHQTFDVCFYVSSSPCYYSQAMNWYK